MLINIFIFINVFLLASDTIKVDSSRLLSTDVKDTSELVIPTFLINHEPVFEENIFDDQMDETKSIFAEAIISDLTGDTLEAAYQFELLFEALANIEVLSQDEIDRGLIKDKNGKALLDLFGIDNKRFCTIFNDKVKTKGGKVLAKPNPAGIKALLESGIGYGYHVIHQMRGKVLSKKMDKKAMKAAARVGKCTIHYGGKTGKGKRIDMEMESPYYKFKLNIRDTQGKDGYPTRMMCDFTTL